MKPVNILQKHYGHFHFLQTLPFQPYVKKPLGKESKDARFIGIIGRDIDALLQREENVKKPGTIFVKVAFLHDEHIQDVQRPAIHDSGESIRVAGIFLSDDLLDFVQVFLKWACSYWL